MPHFTSPDIVTVAEFAITIVAEGVAVGGDWKFIIREVLPEFYRERAED